MLFHNTQNLQGKCLSFTQLQRKYQGKDSQTLMFAFFGINSHKSELPLPLTELRMDKCMLIYPFIFLVTYPI